MFVTPGFQIDSRRYVHITHSLRDMHTPRSLPTAAFLTLCAILLTACGTIMHGTSLDLGISSSPTNATVMIDNAEAGMTPIIGKLSRKDNHIIRIQLAGYQPFEGTVTRKVSGWVWGNIVFGGLIGLAVDAISGGLYALTPEQIAGQLTKQGASLAPAANGVYVILVRHVDVEWTQIGTLTRE